MIGVGGWGPVAERGMRLPCVVVGDPGGDDLPSLIEIERLEKFVTHAPRRDAIGRPHRVGSQRRGRYPVLRRPPKFLPTLLDRSLAWDRLGWEPRRKARALDDAGWERSTGTLIRRPAGRTT
jgi:hypothetical protein